MRKSFVALLLLGAAACLATTAFAGINENGDELGLKLKNARDLQMTKSAVQQLGTSGPGDTTWIGYSTDPAVTNYWKVGPGPNRPLGPTSTTTGAWQWDFAVNGDSLQGWWPVRWQHVNASGAVRTDVNRPWWAIEVGNQSNYVINQGRYVAGAANPAPNNRTFGVVGVWHSDPGPVVGTIGIVRAPLAGTKSAWMGLRQHGDLTVVDPITGNPYNFNTQEMSWPVGNTAAVTVTALPGYVDQMDQMLYRDIDISSTSGPITIGFQFATQMSTGKGTTAATRTGWFEGDPLTVNSPTPGNFISAEAGTPANAEAPIDSFQVYVGKPVEGTWVASDNATRPIYDPLRRWFNEVLDKNARFWKFGAFGNNAPGTASVVVSATEISAIKAGGNNTLRVVFRVHTNRGFSDITGPTTYTSGGLGAAHLDDVTVDFGGGPTVIGDFEGTDASKDIDNLQPATAAWRSTGKPPAIYFHTHDLATLPWDDLCGDINSIIRICDMRGGVISMGDHDAGEAAGGLLGTAEEEGNWGMVSPTVNLKTPAVGKNAWGLDEATAQGTQGYGLWYEGYWGIFDIFSTGNAWQFGAMAYPGVQPATGPAPGTQQWGDPRLPQFLYFNPLPQCYPAFEDLSSQGQILSANAPNRPDSVRVFLRKLQQCYRFGVVAGCSPTDGAYFDNISFVILDGSVQAMAIDIWNLFNDTFPFTEDGGLPGTAAFDTTSAMIKTGINQAQTTNTLQRFVVPGDSVVVQASAVPGEQIRVDMIFRIKPGVGNYVTVGNVGSGMRQVPTSITPVTAGDGSFWGQYMATPGEFATPGAVALHAAAPSGWDVNVWNSARCDTSQGGLFPISRRGIGDWNSGTPGVLDPNQWMSTYHESDSKYTTLGIAKPMCFLTDTLGAPNATNITCGAAPVWLSTVPTSQTGWASNLTTIEATKILPDGILTPGAHVQYFFTKRTLSNPAVFDMVPDTNTVFTQPLESSFDAHRWQQFGVLPDRWKDGAFTPGSSMACMLYVDYNDRRGDERVWVSTADSIGATQSAKRGAHNGWAGPGGVSVNDPTYFVAKHGGQPGSTWDMYGVKASESLTTQANGIGARLSYRDPSPTNLVHNKYSKTAPTIDMLDKYYKILLVLTGDLNSGVFGPFPDRSSDDRGTMTQFLALATPTAPRGILIQGDGMAESEFGDPFLTDVLGMDLLDSDYRAFSTNPALFSDLIVNSTISPAGDIYGVRNGCTFTNDVLLVNPGVPEAVIGSEYTRFGAGTFISGVYKPASAARPWIALTDGFDIFNLTGRYDVSNKGRLAYMYNVFGNIFGSICSVRGSAATTLDTPNNARFFNFAKLAGNPVENRQATILFGLQASDRVQLRIYDVTGRLVRTLSDRMFEAGNHRLVWDGVDDHGSVVARGVYFAKINFVKQGFQSANKMVVLN
jgi:hypothetical protein